ncbi:hypothetical protein GCM10023201_34270 [Actinomycetospora corticicola]|uniref:Uncharacterized protein n=1 Tax=Actinomycetospora corticicola TaxID=663602 RepID=A0A7Y9E0D9_9PSEU|nr:hypothetical protein [Actinomycetospora corticicola]
MEDAAVLEQQAGPVLGPDAATDVAVGLEDDRVQTAATELPRGGETRDPRSDDDDVHLGHHATRR